MFGAFFPLFNAELTVRRSGRSAEARENDAEDGEKK
jgi:hypothetical protein